MSAMASLIIGVSIVYSTVCSGADQRKHQSSASLICVRGIHQWPVNSPHKEPVTRKMLPFDDVIMYSEAWGRIYASVNCVITGLSDDLLPVWPSHYPHHWWFIASWTFMNRRQWNLCQSTKTFIEIKTFKKYRQWIVGYISDGGIKITAATDLTTWFNPLHPALFSGNIVTYLPFRERNIYIFYLISYGTGNWNTLNLSTEAKELPVGQKLISWLLMAWNIKPCRIEFILGNVNLFPFSVISQHWAGTVMGYPSPWKGMSILLCRYRGYCWPGDARIQGINSHHIALLLPE